MQSYSERHVFSATELRQLQLATRMVASLSHSLPGVNCEVRCHELARAVGHLLDLPVVDGYYGHGIEHSWLWTSPLVRVQADAYSPWALPNILDVYVPGGLPQVQLFHTASALPLNHRLGPARSDVKEDVVQLLVKLLLREQL